MFSAISAIATLTRSGTAERRSRPRAEFWLLFFTAVPLLLVCLGGTPDTYHTAGLERGTATSILRDPGQPPASVSTISAACGEGITHYNKSPRINDSGHQ